VLTTVAACALTVLLATLPEPTQGGTGCKVLDDIGSCSVIAVDPGRPGGPHKLGRPAAENDSAPSRQPAPQPLPDGANNGAALGLPAPPAAANRVAPPPAVLAQQAIKSLGLRGPHIRTSAPDSTFVGAPLWLWIDAGAQFTGPLSTTATAGAAQVTVTGTLTGVEWDLGPPDAHVRCNGPGTPWTGQAGPSPDCGYTYTQRSLPERTNGTGRWTITATSVWQVAWTGISAGAPVSGTQIVRVPTQGSLAVGEVQVLVANDSRSGRDR
jgi:hypothetical protein